MGKFIKIGFYIIVVLLIFAILPKNILVKIKNLLNWETFSNTLKKGFENLVNFLKDIGLDFNKINDKIKNIFGINLKEILTSIKKSLANFFLKLDNIFQ